MIFSSTFGATGGELERIFYTLNKAIGAVLPYVESKNLFFFKLDLFTLSIGLAQGPGLAPCAELKKNLQNKSPIFFPNKHCMQYNLHA